MKLKVNFLWMILICLLCGFAWVGLTATVSAQDDTVLAVVPAQINVPLTNQFVVEITVADGEDINAFEIRLIFDQQRLVLLSWAHGGYFGNSGLNCDTESKSPGRLELECRQVAQEVASGDGVMLELAFDTRALGPADITIDEAILIDSQGQGTQPERLNGVVNIQDRPTWTPTFTVTAMTTHTLTATFTQSPTLSPSSTSVDPTASHTPSLTPMETAEPGQNTPTIEGMPTSTLTTPISGVAGPSQRTITPMSTVDGREKTEAVSTEGAVSTDALESKDGESPSADDRVGTEPLETSSKLLGGFFGRLLLVVTFLIFLATVVLVILLIRRRNRENEDLLL